MRVHLVDGTFELFRAHFSKRPDHVAPDGRSVKATIGVAASILALLDDPKEAVTHLAVAFDNPIASFRNDLFAGYKTDAGVPEDLLAQFDPVEEAVRALGVVVWSMQRWEADDALATAAARFRDAVGQVRILTPDKDLGQCLRGRQVVQIDRIRGTEIDEAALRKRRGIAPASVPDFLALVGDDADGIPGLPGIGEKTASALLGRYGRLESIPEDPRAWDVPVRSPERIARSLVEGAEAARLYRTLATLIEDVPLAEDLAALSWRGVPRAAFEAWCRKMGVTTWLDRPHRGSDLE